MRKSQERYGSTAEFRLQHSDNFVVGVGSRTIAAPESGYPRLPLSSFYDASATRLAMDPFDKKPILPVEVMITVAINVAVVMLGYYVMIFWGIIRG